MLLDAMMYYLYTRLVYIDIAKVDILMDACVSYINYICVYLYIIYYILYRREFFANRLTRRKFDAAKIEKSKNPKIEQMFHRTDARFLNTPQKTKRARQAPLPYPYSIAYSVVEVKACGRLFINPQTHSQ